MDNNASRATNKGEIPFERKRIKKFIIKNRLAD